MKVATNGIVFNELTQVLLMQRNDTRTWAPPGGMLDAGELPTDGVAREVQEETGLKVVPVRLVGLYYVPARPDPHLLFSFRCIQRGGSLQTSTESPQVGWFPTRTLPRNLLDFHRERIVQAFHHQGGPPHWQIQPRSRLEHLGWWLMRNLLYRFFDWRRARRGLPAYEEPPSWDLSVSVVLQNVAGELLWIQDRENGPWRLCGDRVAEDETPWQTAVRATRSQTGLTPAITSLAGVYVSPGRSQMNLTFTATVQDDLPGAAAGTCRTFPSTAPPSDIDAHYHDRLTDALAPGDMTLFKLQENS